MAYQNIKRTIIRPTLITKDPNIRMLVDYYSDLAQEVVQCHNRIQQFPVTITTGLTTASFTLPAPTFTTGYIAIFVPSFDAGAWYVSSQTTTAVGITWKTATAGTQSARLLIIE